MGIAHGAFCVGCCWSLMLVMFGVGLASLERDARPGRPDRHREEPAVGPPADPSPRRDPHPGRRLRDRRVSRASYARRVDEPPPTHRDPRRAPRSGDRRHAVARSSPRRATACSRTATPTSRRAASPKPPRSRSARSTTTSARKLQLILAVLAAENERLLERQRAMFDAPEPLWVRWELACDFLDTDVASGYVRILQEMIAAGWSDAEVAASVRGDDRWLVPAPGRGRATRGGARRGPRRVHARRGRGPDGDAVPRRGGADPARRHGGRAADALGAAEGRRAPAPDRGSRRGPPRSDDDDDRAGLAGRGGRRDDPARRRGGHPSAASSTTSRAGSTATRGGWTGRCIRGWPSTRSARTRPRSDSWT